jgi:hypothetical protein
MWLAVKPVSRVIINLGIQIKSPVEDPGAGVIGLEPDRNYATVDSTEVHCIPYDRVVEVVRVRVRPPNNIEVVLFLQRHFISSVTLSSQKCTTR